MALDIMKIGILIIFIGIILVVFSAFFGSSSKESKVAIIGFIGPIPIGFGNDKKLLFATAMVGIILFLFFLFWRRSL